MVTREELFPAKFEFTSIIEWEEWKKDILPRLRASAGRVMPHLPQLEPHGGKCIVVGAGPSVSDHVDDIRKFEGGNNIIMSLNGAHDWLIRNFIVPSLHVIFEHDLERIEKALGGLPHKDVTYYTCSILPEVIFKALEGHKKVLWHSFCPPQGYQQAIARNFPGEFMVAGGHCTFFRTLNIAMILGYRDFELFGCDCSFKDSSHVDGYANADIEPRINIWGAPPTDDGELRQFVSQGGLAFVAREFIEFCKCHQDKLSLRVHGDSLLNYLHSTRYPEQYERTAQ